MKDKGKLILFFIIISVLIVVDQLTKYWAAETLEGKEPRIFLGDFFRLEYVENTGAFLSLGSDWPDLVSLIVFSILPLLLMSYLVYYVFKNRNIFRTLKVISFALIISGGIGNIIDRIAHDRHVIDFMNMGIGNLRTGIFNVADLGVTGGVILLLFFWKDPDPTEETETAPEA